VFTNFWTANAQLVRTGKPRFELFDLLETRISDLAPTEAISTAISEQVSENAVSESSTPKKWKKCLTVHCRADKNFRQ
jgi:hypothetical protein